MPNHYNSDVGEDMMANEKEGEGGPRNSRTSAAKGSLNIKSASWGALPGKTGPNRNTTGARKVKTYTQSNGV